MSAPYEDLPFGLPQIKGIPQSSLNTEIIRHGLKIDGELFFFALLMFIRLWTTCKIQYYHVCHLMIHKIIVNLKKYVIGIRNVQTEKLRNVYSQLDWFTPWWMLQSDAATCMTNPICASINNILHLTPNEVQMWITIGQGVACDLTKELTSLQTQTRMKKMKVFAGFYRDHCLTRACCSSLSACFVCHLTPEWHSGRLYQQQCLLNRSKPRLSYDQNCVWLAATVCP